LLHPDVELEQKQEMKMGGGRLIEDGPYKQAAAAQRSENHISFKGKKAKLWTQR